MSAIELLSRLKKSNIHINLVNNNLKINALKGKLTPTLLKELREKKQEIIRFLKDVQLQPKDASIKKAEKKEYYPLSPAQKRLYILQQMEIETTLYNMSQVIPCEGDLDLKKLEETFKKLIYRHESLRTSFEMKADEPVQKVHDTLEFEIELYDLTGEQSARSRQVIENFERPFDLSRAPLLRVGFINRPGEEQILLLDIHHIVTDGTSQDILNREFKALYGGEELEPLRLQYKDYSQWQNCPEQVEAIKSQEKYWLDLFSGEVPVLNIPMDFPRPSLQSFEGASVKFILNNKETSILKNIARKNDATLFMVLLAVFTILLSKLSGQEDIIVGIPIEARRHADLENIIGMFVNSLAMRNYPEGEKTFNRFLREVKKQTTAAYENQEYQFEDLVDTISISRDTSRNPVFDVMFNLLNQAEYPQDLSQIDEQTLHKHERSKARFDMAFSAIDVGEKLFFVVEYCTKLFKASTIERFILFFKRLVTLLPENNENKISHFDITSEGEKEKILYFSQGIKDPLNANKTIHQLFEDRVKEKPGEIAVEFEGNFLSYNELNRRANQLAGWLRTRGVKPDEVVGLMVERSLEMIIGILGIMKAGGAYLPIDPGYPRQRVLGMLEDSGVSLLLTTGKAAGYFSFTSLKGIKTLKVLPHVTPPRPPIKDFDALPKPDRTLVDYSRYHKYIGIALAKHTVHIQATRGCPYNCAYCHKIWPKTHVVRSAENIFDEIKACCNAGLKRFVFIDDIFNLRKDNSRRLMEKIIQQEMNIQMFFPNGLRGDILTKDFIDLMIEAGTVDITLALESASPRIQQLIKKNLNLEKFAENIDYIREKYPHILSEIEMMIGFPTETEEEAMMTLDFLMSREWIHFPNLHLLKIYPNTDMYRLAVENGISPRLIEASTDLAYHEASKTLPFPESFARQYQATFLNDYILSKERLLKVLPYQVNVLTEDELAQKYNSYLPMKIRNFNDILKATGISREELGKCEPLKNDSMAAPNFSEKMRKYFPKKEKKPGTFNILLLDLSQLFSSETEDSLYDVTEEPLGLMYLMTYLNNNEKIGEKVHGKVAKSRIDFDSYRELKALVNDVKPHLIGIRTLTIYKEFFHKTVSLLRQWGIKVPIIAGGPYATSDYSLILQDLDVDLVVRGEGELTFTQLVEEMLANDNRLPGQDTLKQINGIAFIKNNDKEVLKKINREIIPLDKIADELSQYPGDNLPIVNQPGDLVYTIYTSGSTGKPKASMLEHRNLVNLLMHQFHHTNLDLKRVLQFITISFDVSFQEIFSTFLAGGTLYLIDKETQRYVPGLFKLIEEKQIETLFLPASFLKFVLSEKEFLERLPADIKHIVTAGEQVIVTQNFKQYLKENKVYLHNHYGPAETHVVTALTLDPANDIPVLPPIGKPIINTDIFILSSGMYLQPIGIPGELYIGGSQVSRGYLGKPVLTYRRFIPSPLLLISYKSKQKKQAFEMTPQKERHQADRESAGVADPLYRTGDLARWLPDGNIAFLGRIDHQVKIRGFRIEPGEIEQQLLNHNAVKEAVVIAAREKTGTRLYAYFVPGNPHHPAASLIPGIKAYLADRMPDYMIPHLVQLERIPLTPNGKIDRRALVTPGEEPGYAAPRNEVEKRLQQLWSEVLKREKETISIDSNFFELGGHSLNATILVNRLHKEFGVKLTLVEMFKTPTIPGLAHCLQKSKKNRYRAIVPTPKKEYYPLTSVQKRLFFLDQFENIGTSYNMLHVVPLPGNIEKEKLEEIFEKLIERHESLRTSFKIVGEESVQEIHDRVEFEIRSHEVEAKSPAPGTGRTGSSDPSILPTEAEAIVRGFSRPFDLSKAPLLRAALLKIPGEKQVLLFDMHHIITDAASQVILANDFMKLYAGEEPEPLRLQYKDFAGWQKSPQHRERIRQQQAYWARLFADELPVLNLPTDFPRPAVQDFEGAFVNFVFNEKETKNLKNTAKEADTTLYITLLSVFTVLLSKLSAQEDIIIGTPIAARRHADLESIVGMFVNTLAMRNFSPGDQTFSGFLQEVKQRTLAAFENQEFPFEDLVDTISIDRDTGRNPVFDVMFNLLDRQEYSGSIRAIDEENIYRHKKGTSKFDMNLSAFDFGEKILFELEYCTKLFKASTIERIIGYFRNILSFLSTNRDVEIQDIEMITRQEKEKIIKISNGVKETWDAGKTIHRLFEEKARHTPDGTALVLENKNLSYKELNKKANQLATVLRKKGISWDTIVGLMVGRSLDMIISILAVMKAGGAYLPIDPAYPAERIRYMLEDSSVSLLLTRQNVIENSTIAAMSALALDEILLLDEISRKLSRYPVENLESINSDNDLLYVIYTSGSTGTPKGVMLQHRNLVNLIRYQYCCTDIDFSRVLQFSTISFDVSAQEIFSTLLAGGVLSLVPREMLSDVPGLFKKVKENHIKTLFLPTSFLKFIINEEDFLRLLPANVKHIVTAGEQMIVNKRFKHYLKESNVYFHNHYGPSETHVVTAFTVRPGEDTAELPPIGRPVANTSIYLLDKGEQPVPVGVTGELFIRGAQVGRGYLNNPELTAEKFVAAKSHELRAKLYKTGDLARWLTDGNIEFLGRIDRQVKIRGFRIELGEIEARMLKHPAINEVVVLAGEDNISNKYLCAYIVLDRELKPSELRQFLSRKLPGYMIPDYFMDLEHIPLTPNGKIDREKLPRPELKAGTRYIAPRDKIEKELVEIWSDVLTLEKDKISTETNFFNLGGHSLRATVMAAKIHKQLDVKIPLSEIFKSPTIRGLAQYIRDAETEEYRPLEPTEKKEYYRSSSAQKRLYFIQEMDVESTAYNLPMIVPFDTKLTGPDVNKKKLEHIIYQLIHRHESFRTSFAMIADQPVQKIHHPGETDFEIEYCHLKGNDGDTAKTIVSMFRDFVRPFHLYQTPLIRALLVEKADRCFILMVDMHHIISDGISHDILVREFMALLRGGQLPPLRLQYKDYTEGLNREEIKKSIDAQEEYWLAEFKGEISLLNLPTDYPRSDEIRFQGDSIIFSIDETRTAKLKKLAHRFQVSAMMFLLSIYNVLLAQYSGQQEIIVGTVIAGRKHADLENIIGFFVNMLAIKTFHQKNKRFSQYMQEVKEKTVNAYENQDYQFEILVGKLPIPRQSGRHPLVDVVFSFRENQEKNLDIKPSNVSHFDLMLVAYDAGDSLQMAMEYSTALFKKSTITQLSNFYIDILDQVVEYPSIQLKDIRVRIDLSTSTSPALQEDKMEWDL